MAINLTSRIVRQTTKNRKISVGKGVRNVLGFFKPIVGIIGGIVKWAFNFLKISISKIFGLIYETTITLLNFDWNASDAQLAQLIEQNNIQMMAQAGTLVGGSLAWIVCIGGAAFAELKIPVLRGKLAVALAKEGGDQALSLLTNFLTTTARNLAINAIIASYANVRKFLLSDTGVGRAIGQFLFGNNYQHVKEKWGKSAEPWIISQKIEDAVQSIPNAGLRAFTEGLLDEFGDELTECLFEAVYIIQQTYDDQIAVQDYAYGYDYQSPEIVVDVTPDSTSIVPLRASNEVIRVTAPNQLVLKHRINEVISTAKIMDNRDVGIVVGEPAEDRITTTPLSRQLVLTFRGQPKPPFKNPDGFPSRVVTVTIPEPKPGLSWTTLKQICRPYVWGKFLAVAQLTMGRKIKLFAGNAAEAENKLREFHSICNLDILSISVTEEGYRKNPGLVKYPQMVYPQYATLTIRRDNLGVGRSVADGRTLSQEIQQIILWTDREPPGTPVLL
ncbi:MAG: hypothetical protein CV045_10605 [Cyanobacteria bacterium M5B4]|nr:MAG: hypothetical protein CV045_10605 [Cyanobacteria bacterium M5B4]